MPAAGECAPQDRFNAYELPCAWTIFEDVELVAIDDFASIEIQNDSCRSLEEHLVECQWSIMSNAVDAHFNICWTYEDNHLHTNQSRQELES